MPSSPPHRRPYNHYSVLGLVAPVDTSSITGHPKLESKTSKADIKNAYRRALLSHHPDKRNGDNESSSLSNGKQQRLPDLVTIDEIVKAYQILSDDESRKQYDQELIVESPRWMRTCNTYENSVSGRSRQNPCLGETQHRNSEEIIYKSLDLDDMSSEETSSGKQIWSTSCRCGLLQGYTITEDDLEGGSQHGANEAWAQCSGCSLWIVVAYELNEDENHDIKDF